MKMLFSVLALTLSFSAQALEVYNCDFAAVDKRSSAEIAWVKRTFLSADFSNQETFDKTVLDLTLRSGKISGTVNGQPQFILEGTPAEGRFESAYHKGTVRCDSAVRTEYLLKFIPWNQYYTLDKELSRGHIQNSADISQLYHRNICFIGNASAVAKAVSAQAAVKAKVVDDYRVDFTFQYTSCVRGHGGRDDFECDQYKTETLTKPLMNCAGDGWVDPRS